MGNSTNKKDAQANAARDFVNYLVRVGQMSASEVPALGVSMSGMCVHVCCAILYISLSTDIVQPVSIFYFF